MIMTLGSTWLSKGLLRCSAAVSRRRFVSSTPAVHQTNKKYWILQYKYNPKDILERRAPWRPQHLALANEYVSKGKLVLGGAFSDPIDGALILFTGEKEEVEEFIRKDPYVTQGVATDPVIREWNVVTGSAHKKQEE